MRLYGLFQWNTLQCIGTTVPNYIDSGFSFDDREKNTHIAYIDIVNINDFNIDVPCFFGTEFECLCDLKDKNWIFYSGYRITELNYDKNYVIVKQFINGNPIDNGKVYGI